MLVRSRIIHTILGSPAIFFAVLECQAGDFNPLAAESASDAPSVGTGEKIQRGPIKGMPTEDR